MAKSSCSNRSEAGFTLLEVCVAMGILIAAIASLAQMFAVSTRTNTGARMTTYTAVLAEQKLEELRALTWGFDMSGLPISDTSTNTAVNPETPNGGTGLQPSPGTSLQENTAGYVDFIDQFGNKLQAIGNEPPPDAVFIRRWSVEPLPTNPNNTLIIQVLVTRFRNRGFGADQGNVRRQPDEARLITVKTRKSQ